MTHIKNDIRACSSDVREWPAARAQFDRPIHATLKWATLALKGHPALIFQLELNLEMPYA